ncbi:MAG: hypothetical protein ED556_12655 [Winogradskyella sp.]|uniref:hypothetical protein n=1 Tax=Winogradskyella sp. TaxID=1883156 RepID=UPI000F3D0C45|nr:hypothetical protein [Winogradskyella sp.]RNC84295.1 MAG: hypothetical protein ED556_12655 [Winogradskyella sp.]
MNKKTFLTGLSTLLITIFSFSQGLTSIDVSTEKLYMSSDVSKPIDALGSPYINENFLPVKIKGYDNVLYTGRYNAYNGEMEINLGTKIIALDKTQPYEVTFTQNNKNYKTFNFISKTGVAKSGFLNVIDSATTHSLLKEETIRFVDKVPAATSYQRDKPAKFIANESNYYLKVGDKITPVPTRKKDLLKSYAKDAKKIKSYLKDNKVSLKKEEDIKKLALYLASL